MPKHYLPRLFTWSHGYKIILYQLLCSYKPYHTLCCKKQIPRAFQQSFQAILHHSHHKLCHIVPYNSIHHHAISYNSVPRFNHTLPFCAIPYQTIPKYKILYQTIPYHTIYVCNTTPRKLARPMIQSSTNVPTVTHFSLILCIAVNALE